MLLFLVGGREVSPAQSEWDDAVLVSFVTEPEVKTDQGFVQLEWKPELKNKRPIIFTLEQSNAPFEGVDHREVRVVYKGPDRSSFISGLPEGKTYFRVGAQWEGESIVNWAGPVVVDVTYVSADFVITWLIVGAVVFAVTVIAVVGGHLRSKQEPIV